MERVTFQDDHLMARIRQTCVPTWRNVLPGFETASLDRPILRDAGRFLQETAATSPGLASANISTVFSLPDGRVVHVAPGLFDAAGLLRELEFAVAVRDAVVAAGPEAAAQARACAWEHAARMRAAEAGESEEARAALARVHATLAERPLLALDALRLEDYSGERFDAKSTLLQGRQVADLASLLDDE